MQVRNLNFYYGKLHALHNINLDVAANRVTALIGPSGCGKSTLLAHAQPHARDRARMPAWKARFCSMARDILAQDVSPLAPPRGHGVSEAQSVSQVDLRQCRLRPAHQRLPDGPHRSRGSGREEPAPRRALGRGQGQLHKSAYALSGGQQQRLCIARALAVEPECCFSTSLVPRSIRSIRPRSRSCSST